MPSSDEALLPSDPRRGPRIAVTDLQVCGLLKALQLELYYRKDTTAPTNSAASWKPEDVHPFVVEVDFTVPDRDDPTKAVPLTMTFPTTHQPGSTDFIQAIREAIHRVLCHEADESLLVRGERPSTLTYPRRSQWRLCAAKHLRRSSRHSSDATGTCWPRYEGCSYAYPGQPHDRPRHSCPSWSRACRPASSGPWCHLRAAPCRRRSRTQRPRSRGHRLCCWCMAHGAPDQPQRGYRQGSRKAERGACGQCPTSAAAAARESAELRRRQAHEARPDRQHVGVRSRSRVGTAGTPRSDDHE